MRTIGSRRYGSMMPAAGTNLMITDWARTLGAPAKPGLGGRCAGPPGLEAYEVGAAAT